MGLLSFFRVQVIFSFDWTCTTEHVCQWLKGDSKESPWKSCGESATTFWSCFKRL